VTALRLGTVQLCRVSRDFSTRATGGISRRLLPLPSLALGKPPIRTFPLDLREGCFNARAGLHRRMLWISKRAAIFSPRPSSTAHRLPNASIVSFSYEVQPCTVWILTSCHVSGWTDRRASSEAALVPSRGDLSGHLLLSPKGERQRHRKVPTVPLARAQQDEWHMSCAALWIFGGKGHFARSRSPCVPGSPKICTTNVLPPLFNTSS
jgi:hypothetical protein